MRIRLNSRYALMVQKKLMEKRSAGNLHTAFDEVDALFASVQSGGVVQLRRHEYERQSCDSGRR